MAIYLSRWRAILLSGKVLQDTFKGFIQRRDQLRPDTKLATFLHRIAERRLVDCIRRETAQKRDFRQTTHPDQWNGAGHFSGGNEDEQRDNRMAGHIADPKADPAVRDRKLDLDEAMRRLSATERQALQLELEGHTHESAAQVANVPASTHWSRVRSARKHIKEFLTPTIILLAIVGAVFDNCDLDQCMNLCAAETDEDEVCRESGQAGTSQVPSVISETFLDTSFVEQRNH